MTHDKIDNTAVVSNCMAVNFIASSGYRFMACSRRQNPIPKANGCSKLKKSPLMKLACSIPSSSKSATPMTATNEPITVLDEGFFPDNQSNIGTITTANEQMNALVLARVVSSPNACATYPSPVQQPISKPVSKTLRRFEETGKISPRNIK